MTAPPRRRIPAERAYPGPAAISALSWEAPPTRRIPAERAYCGWAWFDSGGGGTRRTGTGRTVRDGTVVVEGLWPAGTAVLGRTVCAGGVLAVGVCPLVVAVPAGWRGRTGTAVVGR